MRPARSRGQGQSWQSAGTWARHSMRMSEVLSPAARVRAKRREDTIARLRAFLADHPPPGAERVILFGSLARGDYDGASDADLMVISGEGSIDTGIWDAAERGVDISPWKAEAWARARAQGHP